MARKDFEILDKEETRSRSASARYEIIVGSLDGRPEMYDPVAQLEDNGGDLTVYRDIKTTATIAVHGRLPGDKTLLALVVNESKIDETLDRIKSVSPNIFRFRENKNGKT